MTRCVPRAAGSLALWAMCLSAASGHGQPASPPVALTVEDATARALAMSHRLDEATARGRAADAVVDQRRAALLPRLGAQAGYTRTNHIETFGILLPNDQLRVIYPDIPDNYRTRLDAQWPIYTGGRLQALERAARTEAAAAAQDAHALRADLRVEVARAYWALVAARETVRVLDRALTQVGVHLADARARLDAGLVPPNEVLSAEAQQARQQMLRAQAVGSSETAEAALVRLTGLPPGTSLQLTSEPTPAPDDRELLAATPHMGDLLALAREARADRRALAERVAATRLRAAAAGAGRRPTVAVAGGFDYARPNPRIFPRLAEWRQSWDASVNVDWPLFDAGRANADVAEATAAGRAAEARLAEFDSMLALEIQQRLSERGSSLAAIAAADVAVRAATEAHRVLGERFRAGVATSTEVLDAEMAILQAQLDRTQALATLRIAEAGLARAIGR
ncbi:MAG: TolC family protein [Vicinamibacterales bacterium]